MSLLRKVLRVLGIYPTKEDIKLKELVDNSYKSVRVVGRGAVRICPNEVRNSEEFKEALTKAREIVEDQNEKGG